MTWMRWRPAMERALYGAQGGFYRRPEGPAGHFRTSVHASAQYGSAVGRLLLEVDEALGHPPEIALIDVGAGRGELVGALCDLLPGRLRAYGVELAARPDGLPAQVRWTERVPEGAVGLLFANEWLDNVPLEIAERDEAGVLRYVEVSTTGEERLGAPLTGADAAWAQEWWPAGEQAEGERVELGGPRDEAWAAAVGALERGLAVAVDYAHRTSDRPTFGTLTGFRDGREVPPVPDGSCDLTAHVALDSVAVPGIHSLWTTQRAALRALGVDGTRPPLALATEDPAGYLRALAAAGEAAELTASAGLGGFGWLLQAVRMPVPRSFQGLPGWQTLEA
ncbi:SAM-dependent methyltransferase [Kitasatospora sp. GAS204B]|uniref:SAM-dependent methyltransferase n=1 Tax=unclassified Kitasatospora TaxID=2633591 RepID=UPI00247684DA|nr:SAM-dependent methyltransferase [Kitasatospora sp. GAS204B]MDH6116738.1 SAM-dependent MidA family methyltransferase [Kitasatospora sp. GAS204B]